MRIRINKLFGKYVNEIDLLKRCNILVGENGTGKSTMLKIIDCIIKNDPINLCKYKFESIDFYFENKKIRLRKSELFPKLNELQEKIINLIGLAPNEVKDISNSEKELFEELNKNGLLYDYLSSCYFNLPIGEKTLFIEQSTKYNLPEIKYIKFGNTDRRTVIKNALESFVDGYNRYYVR